MRRRELKKKIVFKTSLVVYMIQSYPMLDYKLGNLQVPELNNIV
jgi:hypothetical protein